MPYDGEEHRGNHPPLVDPSTFAACQLVLRSHRHGERRQARQHPLKGRIFCGRCGSHLSFGISKGNHPYFFCLARHGRDHSCALPYLPVADVEAAVVEQFSRLGFSLGQRRHLVSALQRELTALEARTDEQAVALRARRTRLEREQASLLDAFYAGVLSRNLISGEQNRIAAELAAVQRDQEQLAAAQLTDTHRHTNMLELARSLDLAEAYRSAPEQVQRFLLRACFRRVELDDLGTLTRSGHGLDHDVRIVKSRQPRTLDYQQLVYGVLLLDRSTVSNRQERELEWDYDEYTTTAPVSRDGRQGAGRLRTVGRDSTN